MNGAPPRRPAFSLTHDAVRRDRPGNDEGQTSRFARRLPGKPAGKGARHAVGPDPAGAASRPRQPWAHGVNHIVTTSRGGGAPSDDAQTGTELTADAGFRQALQRVRATLACSTVPGGLFLTGSHDGAELHVACLPMAHAWGLAADAQRLAVAAHREIMVFARTALPPATHPDHPDQFDAFFTPRITFFTGECLIHDMAIVRTGLLVSNTRFSNVSIIDGRANFDPIWHPPYISAITPEDRCHLNGIAVEDGRLRYVTAFGPFDEANGWRDHDPHTGVIMDVERNCILRGGMCLPHSPRLCDGRLFVLEAGTGTVLQVDRGSGQTTAMVTLPGFARGLVVADGIMFVGLSTVRDTAHQLALPLTRTGAELLTGVAAVDVERATVLGLLRFNDRREIFDVALIPSVSRVAIANIAASGGYYAVDSRAGGYWMRVNGTSVESLHGQNQG